MTTNFNPRTRVECDLIFVMIYIYKKHFNPRTRVECDDEVTLTPAEYSISIHALV